MSQPGSRSFDLRVQGENGTDDYRLSLADGDVTIAEVFDAFDLPRGTMIDGQVVVEPARMRAVDVLSSGVGLTISGEPSAVRVPAHSSPLVELAVVAGYDAASLAQLGGGVYRVSNESTALDDGWYVEVTGAELAASDSEPWHVHASTIEAIVGGGLVLTVGRPVEIEGRHSYVVHRPPRVPPPPEVESIEIVGPPSPVSEPALLSWATLLAPLPIAVMMAFFFRPMFALFALMGPVMAAGRWYESKRRFRREVFRRDREVEAMVAAVETAAQEQAESVARHRWISQPHVAELWRRARTKSVRLWERRPDGPGYLVVSVGIGRDHVPASTHGSKTSEEIHQRLTSPLTIRPVPHTLDLTENSGVGIHGKRSEALAVARSIVLQLATLQGPADLRIGVLTDHQGRDEWDWIKWLPHRDASLTSDAAQPIAQQLAAADRGGSDRRSARVATRAKVGTVRLVIVDDVTADVAALCRAADLAGHDLRVVAVAPGATTLPATCSSLVRVDGADAEISSPDPTGRLRAVCPVGVTRQTASSWARSLAALTDPEVDEFTVGGDKEVSLLHLVGYDSASELAERWSRRGIEATAETAVGQAEDGPFRLNLAEDGPHMLIAGTTGSGKSELLRTLVVGLAVECPPEHLNFVLVDFKGGGAFDAVSGLPHVAGLITDLDEVLVERALTSLRAELQRREALFRALGVSRYEDAVCHSEEPLARLVVVIDEFAALATDYTELMTGIIDLASRGRSLGMHLVLATQRPSGVVDQKIRANTNLRVALRVQDAFDSQDVIGTADAARIDRKSPGRAILSVGGDTPVTAQMAHSGMVDTRSTRCLVEPHRLFIDDPHRDREPGVGASNQDRSRTELDVLVDAIMSVSAARSYQARPLWSEPLPATLDWIDLTARDLTARDLTLEQGTGGSMPTGVAIGLVDLPERQHQMPWRWDPDSGSLAVYAGSAKCAAKVLVSVGAGLASTEQAESLHLYVIDGGAGGTAPLAELESTGAYITLDETDRVERAVRFFEMSLAERRSLSCSDEQPRLVLLVDNLAAVLSMLDEVDAASLVERLSGIVRDGCAHRIHLVITARTVRDIGYRLSQLIANRLVLALADSSGYLTLGVSARDVPDLPDMRAIDLRSKRVLHLVEPPDLSSLPNQAAPDVDRRAPPVRAFPDVVCRRALPAASMEAGLLHIPVGIEAELLDVATLTLHRHDHALIVAANGMGRSTMIATILHQLDDAGLDLDLLRFGPAHSPIAEVAVSGSLVTTAEEIDEVAARFSESSGREMVLVVDDAHRLAADETAALQRLTDKAEGCIRIIAATSPRDARSVRTWTSGISEAGTGILLGGTPTDGDAFNVRLGRRDGGDSHPGRGHLVIRGQVQRVQFAHPNAATGKL